MRRFASLFAGRTDCFGKYTVTEQRSDGKQKGRGSTVREQVTPDTYAAHLAGRIRIGLVPIRLDATVVWFAGDIDDYKVNIQDVEKKCQQHNIPVVVCRSKSGGAHLHCFVRGAVKADLAIKLMRHWVTLLGYPKAEVFPKQAEVTEETYGNWINLPYHKAEDPDAYAIGINGEKLSLEEFEQLAEARSPTSDELIDAAKETVKKDKKVARSPLDGCPPCVEKMFAEGIGEGGRNNALTQIGIFFLKSDGDNWRERLMEANYKVFDDPLPIDEVQQIVRNVAKAKYEYLCNLEPMCSLCDKDACKDRKWGVGPQRGIDYGDCEIDRIVKINSDPPIYFVLINGKSVRMETAQLLSPSAFRRRVYEVTGNLISPIKERAHEARILGARMDVEEAPNEVNMAGQVLEAFHEWCEVHIPNARTLSEVLRGNPFFDLEKNQVVFRAQDLIAAFKRQKKFNIADRDVWSALRELGCQNKNVSIDGKDTKVWLFPVEKPWFDLPTAEAF
jgi:hypothetical protein